jgi:mannose-6-phosphate isomerase-like protein (cupin superfamily)
MDLDSAILYTSDIARIRKFYEETVGLTFEYQDGDHFVSFIFPNGGRLGINKSWLVERERPGGQTVFIRVKEAKVQYEKYKSLGFAFFEPYEEHDWGTYFAVLDPDGNKIGFIQPPDLPKAAKYSASEATLIDLGPTKKIHKYPSPMRQLDIARMVVDGRHPVGKDRFVLEHSCSFVMHVTKGRGKFYVGDEVFEVKPGDVVFVPTDHKFAVEGKLEYITIDSPAYYPEQTQEISG